MAWARIDDAFDDHPKVLALLDHDEGAAAIGLWTLCLAWANRNTRRKGKTPGRLPASLPRRYLGVQGKQMADLLVKVGLWDPAEDGWQIHDFDQYLPNEQTKVARSEAGKRGAAKRWADKHAGADSKMPSADSNLPSPSHDVASGELANDGKPVANDGSRAPARREWVSVSEEVKDRTSVTHPQSQPAPPAPVASGDGVLIELPMNGRRAKGPEPGSDDDPKWLKFWAVFPHKVSKKEARAKWAKLVRSGVDPDVIIAGAVRFAAEMRRVGRPKDKIKHPDAWLNGERWDDEYDDPTASGEFGYEEVAAWSPNHD